MSNTLNNNDPLLRESLKDAAPVTRKECLLLFSSVILSLIIHSYFVFDGFGEPDAARIATQAVLYHSCPEQYKISQVTPLYQIALVGCLSLGLDKTAIPGLMNYTNLVLGSFSLIPLYLLWRRISSPWVSTLSCVLYSLTPAFWFANIYGMPHLPAFFFLLWAALLFLRALSCTRSSAFIGYSALSAGLMILSLTCKVDVALYSGIFIGLVAACRAWTKRNIAAALMIPLAALGISFIAIKFFYMTRLLSVRYASNWHAEWPTDITALKSTIPVWSVGAVFLAGILFSGLYGLFNPSLRRYVMLAIAWAMPASLFWCLRWGNSIRHMMIVFSVLIFLLALTLIHCCPGRRKLYLIIGTAILLNYVWMPVEHRYVNKGGRLIETARSIQAYHNTIMQNGIDLCNAPCDEVVLVGQESIPFVIWELLLRYDLKTKPETSETSYTFFDEHSQSWQCRTTDAVTLTLETSSGHRKIVRYFYVPLNTTLLNDSPIPCWSCQESVTVVNRPSEGLETGDSPR